MKARIQLECSLIMIPNQSVMAWTQYQTEKREIDYHGNVSKCLCDITSWLKVVRLHSQTINYNKVNKLTRFYPGYEVGAGVHQSTCLRRTAWWQWKSILKNTTHYIYMYLMSPVPTGTDGQVDKEAFHMLQGHNSWTNDLNVMYRGNACGQITLFTHTYLHVRSTH